MVNRVEHKNSLRPIRTFILDTLFPISCLECSRENFWLCPDCLAKIRLQEIQVCPVCEKEITLGGLQCQLCRTFSKNDLNGLISAARYDLSALKQLIRNLKYRFVADSAHPLGSLMAKSFFRSDLPLPALIVPVPLHPRRLRWRGFNQSELLARELSHNLATPLLIPVENILMREKYNKPQMEIKNYPDRLKNVKGIFCALDSARQKLKNKTVLLVDDIATTGATLQECAKILKENGAKKVFAIVVARQSLKK
jgi:ComF family protein